MYSVKNYLVIGSLWKLIKIIEVKNWNVFCLGDVDNFFYLVNRYYECINKLILKYW